MFWSSNSLSRESNFLGESPLRDSSPKNEKQFARAISTNRLARTDSELQSATVATVAASVAKVATRGRLDIHPMFEPMFHRLTLEVV
jgi:hypothetical protein